MRVSGLIIAAMAASALLAQPAGADPVPISNGTFDTAINLAENGFSQTNQDGTPGWAWSGGSGTGIWNPPESRMSDEAAHGTVAWVSGEIGNAPSPAFLGQVVEGLTIQANTLYTLTLDVGTAFDVPDWGYSFGLLARPSDPATGAFILTSLSGQNDPATGLPLVVGHFTTLSLSFQTGDTGAEIGQSLIIALGGLGRGAAYDNVRLEASSLAVSAVPEPSTWAMMLLGFGAAGTALRRNRKRSAQPA